MHCYVLTSLFTSTVTCKCTLTSPFFPVALSSLKRTFLPRGSHDISDRLIILCFPVYCGLYGKVRYEMLLTHFPNMVYGTLSEIEIALFAVCGMEATIYYRMQNEECVTIWINNHDLSDGQMVMIITQWLITLMRWNASISFQCRCNLCPVTHRLTCSLSQFSLVD